MEETSPITVGVDGSEAARAALRWAIAEAEVHGKPVEVVHAWREPRVLIPRDYDGSLVEEGMMDQAAIDLIDRELDAVGADQPSAVEIRRKPIGSSTGHALVGESRKAAMVVVGRGADRPFLGPRAVQIAHHAKVPVAVVPGDWDGTGTGIIVGIDGSAHAAKAVRWAVEEAATRGTKLTVILAWSYLRQYGPAGVADFDPHYDASEAQVAAEQMVTDALGTDLPPDTTVRAVNDLPARALTEAARGAELLVIGARGLGGFRELLLGSVSHACLADSPCPTVVVR